MTIPRRSSLFKRHEVVWPCIPIAIDFGTHSEGIEKGRKLSVRVLHIYFTVKLHLN